MHKSAILYNTGLCFFIDDRLPGDDYLALLQKAVRYADRAGFSFVFVIDERSHGVTLNPTIIQAALAVQTTRIALRGQCLPPQKRDAIRSVEDWSVVDNLSDGRVGVVIAAEAVEPVFVEELGRLWKGETVKRINGVGNEVALKVFPRPVQEELPVWVVVNDMHDFKKVAGTGMNILVSSLQASWLEKKEGKVTWLVDAEADRQIPDMVDEIAFKIVLSWGEERVLGQLESLSGTRSIVDSL